MHGFRVADLGFLSCSLYLLYVPLPGLAAFIVTYTRRQLQRSTHHI
jgi:hypothetical protein